MPFEIYRIQPYKTPLCKTCNSPLYLLGVSLGCSNELYECHICNSLPRLDMENDYKEYDEDED